MSKRNKIIVASVIIFGAIAYLMVSAFSSSTVYYYTVGEFFQAGDAVMGKTVRVSGKIIGSTIQWDPEQPLLTFDIQADGQTMHVAYNGIKPDTFTDDIEAVAEGVYGDDGTFVADKLLIKCPSKYEATDKTG